MKCSAYVQNLLNLKQHLDSVQTICECSICDYCALRKENLKKHIEAVHEEEKPLKVKCSAYVQTLLNLKEHIDSVQVICECSICDYRALGKEHLKKHIEAVHEGEKPLKAK